MAVVFKNDWEEILNEEFEKDYYKSLRQFLKEEYTEHDVFPNQYDIFNAFHFTAYEDLKVVILGQDPYHGDGQAHGLSFSVQPGTATPPSLKNIFKELNDDLGCDIPDHGYLKPWAEQGVMLLNTVLTVRKKSPNSHKGKGWETFTDKVIQMINEREKPVVFILWGRHAQDKEALIDSGRHFVIKSPHPSPFSANRGFFGSRPFSQVNHYLKTIDEWPINWCLPPSGKIKE